MPTPSLPEASDDSAFAPVRVGDLFDGKWRIESKLGVGGMGSVFLAHDLALDRKVAIKVLARELCLDEQFVSRFEREARLTARLEHPNVVPVYAVGRHRGRPFMVMKCLDGATLAWHLQNEGRLDLARTLDIFKQICGGLAHIHAHGCVHRDVKAGTIFVSPTGHATLLDFGVLRDPSSGDTTRAGTMLGTPRYMSPEQARGALDIDLRADLYALGVLLFECLTGRAPFDAPSDLALIHLHAHAVPPEIRTFNPELPDALGPVVQRALAKTPQERYASADEFCAALEAALAPGLVVAESTGDAEVAFAPAALAEPAASNDPQNFDPTVASCEPAELSAPAIPRARTARWLWPLATGAAVAVAAVEIAHVHFAARAPAPGAAELPVIPAPPLAAKDEKSSTEKKLVKPASGTLPASGNLPGNVNLPASGTLKVTSVLSGKPYAAVVEVDGEEQGETPVSLDLQPGKHEVRVLRYGFQTFEKEVVITSRHTTSLEVDMLP